MIKYADRILETSTTQGTGTINLAGAQPGYQTFVSGVGSGSKVAYFIEDGENWESGVGTVTAGSPATLSRDVVVESSNADAAVDWGAGVRNVFCAASSHFMLWRDENLNDTNGLAVSVSGTGNAHVVTLSPAPLALSNGMIVRWRAPDDNTDAITVNFNSLGVKAYVNNDLQAFAPGRVKAGTIQEAIYNAAENRFERTTMLFGPDASGIGVDDSGFTVLSGDSVQDILDDIDSELADINPGVDIGDFVQLEDIGGGVSGLPAIDGSQLLNVGGGNYLGTQKLTSASGTYAPTSGMKYIEAYLTGSGQSVPNTGGTVTNSSSGATCIGRFTAEQVATNGGAYTIGQPTAPASTVYSTKAQDSTFMGMTAGGGYSAAGVGDRTDTAHSTATGGDINIPGTQGLVTASSKISLPQSYWNFGNIFPFVNNAVTNLPGCGAAGGPSSSNISGKAGILVVVEFG